MVALCSTVVDVEGWCKAVSHSLPEGLWKKHSGDNLSLWVLSWGGTARKKWDQVIGGGRGEGV